MVTLLNEAAAVPQVSIEPALSAETGEISQAVADMVQKIDNAIVQLKRTSVIAFEITQDQLKTLKPSMLQEIESAAADIVGGNEGGFWIVSISFPSGQAARLAPGIQLPVNGEVRVIPSGNQLWFVNRKNLNYTTAMSMPPVIAISPTLNEKADHTLLSNRYANGTSLESSHFVQLLTIGAAYVALPEETMKFLKQIDGRGLAIQDEEAFNNLVELTRYVQLMLEGAREKALTAKAA